MSNKDALRKIIDNYLVDDGLDRDIVVLANQMGIDVYYQRFYKDDLSYDSDFIAFTYINDDRKVICINNNCVNNGDLTRFILAYQIVEYVISDKINFKSFYAIDNMNVDNYMLAKKIFDRSNMKFKSKKKIFNCYKNKLTDNYEL